MLIIFCFLITFLLLILLGFRMEMNDLAQIVTMITAVIGAYSIWVQLRRENRIKEAEFIMEYNNSFISNPKMTEIEELLEKSRKGENITVITDNNRQQVIDYLVYLEALAALIFRKVLSIEVIDDLFMYRFYLAVNNKEIQEKELCPEYLYYKGCFKLYEKWTEYRKEKGYHIMGEENSLDKTKEYQAICSDKRRSLKDLLL